MYKVYIQCVLSRDSTLGQAGGFFLLFLIFFLQPERDCDDTVNEIHRHKLFNIKTKTQKKIVKLREPQIPSLSRHLV